MNRIISAVLITGALISCACNKEEGNTGFNTDDNPKEDKGKAVTLTTDKACYAPGETITFTASEKPAANTYVRYMHLGKAVKEETVTGTEWTWTAPSGDYKGYMAEVYQKLSDGDYILGTVGVDVSSDWGKFPRYGFLSNYEAMTETAVKNVIGNLSKYHINGIQFYDWHWKHHWPLGGTADKPLETYLDVASRSTSLTTLKNYISAIHSHGMKAMFYNLCFGVLDDAAQDGVKESWYIFSDRNHSNKDLHALSAPFKSSIYLVNPANADWQEYIAQKNDDVYKVLDFDGYHIDQLGSRGTRYDYDGNTVSLPEGYASFINAMKAKHPDKDLVMNAVSGYGAENMMKTGKMAFAYDEMWGGESNFVNLRTHIEDNLSYSGGKCNTVFAAYMNYDKAKSLGSFNAPGVLLTNAVIFALGGSHLELGEHMLCSEYFPNSNLGMQTSLQEKLLKYYDFLVAYENLLRDGGELNSVEVTSTDGKVSFKAWEPALGKVVTLGRKVDSKTQVVHLLNFSQANSLSWRDLDGTMPAPTLVENIEVSIPVSGTVSSVWTASPDIDGGAHKELSFTNSSGSISLTIPSLKYWDMIVIEY